MTQGRTGEPPEGKLARAMATIRSLRGRLDELQGNQAVAIVGAGLRLPGGIDTLEAFWDALAGGRDLVRPMPAGRREPFAAEWSALPQRGGFLDEALEFDADFFGISPREARSLDPQHRLLLEVTWEALADAAVPTGNLGDTGFYVGVSGQDYRDWQTGEPDAYWGTGNGHCFAAGRVAYTLGMTGPAIAVDTACSSSLVAVHLAAQALRRAECGMAVAAGVNLVLSPRSTRLLQQTRSMAPDGLCKAFDARANGFTRGEGCGVVVLKRLVDAVRDGDRIHAVLRGSAINQDGRSSGFTAPNVLSQISLIESALTGSGLTPADVGYVEAHGTGTALGDPIEMEALAAALGRRNGGRPLPVGSVKTNLGHLEPAAGLAGLLKAMLCVQRRQVPPVVHFRTLNPRIDLSGTAMFVPHELTDWTAAQGRLAAVSSFGMSGTNAHVLLGAAETAEIAARPAPRTGPVAGFTLSAKTGTALRELARRYARRLADLPAESYPAFAATATLGRSRLPEGGYVEAPDAAAAIAALEAIAAGGTLPSDGPAPDGPRGVPVGLPAYPWQRRRYAPDPPAAPQNNGGTDDWHELVWTPLTPPPPDGGPLILAGDDHDLLARLAGAAAAHGTAGLLLTTGRVAAPDGWWAEPLPTGAAQWAEFWAGFRTRFPAGRQPVATLVLAPAPDHPDPVAAGAAACAAATAAAAAAVTANQRFFLLTQGVRRVYAGDDVPLTTGGALHGLAPVLGLEHGAGFGGVVDLPLRATREDLAAAGAVLTAAGRETVEDLVAVRDGIALGARLSTTTAPTPVSVRPDATYLMTGGLGAVGRELAGELVRLGARHLVVLGRRAPHRIDGPAAGFLEELKADGVTVVYAGGGCDTPAGQQAAVAALSGLPPLRGVVHAAGTIERMPAGDLDAATFAAALRAKVAGAWWLHEVTAGTPMDFFVLVSSVSALWGTEGYAGYAAANGALDGLAGHRAAAGLPVASIAYGPWDVAGMADAGARTRFARMGVRALSAAIGRAALTGHGPEPSGYLVACPLDRQRVGQFFAALRPRGLFAQTVPAAAVPAPVPSVNLAGLPDHRRADAARTHVARLVAVQLGRDDVAGVRPDESFFDLGLDSIMAVDLSRQLAEAFGVPLPVSDVFDYPTVTELAARLAGPSPSTTAPAAATPQRIAFLFAGQGSQYFGMGRELYAAHPVFRESFDACAEAVAPILGTGLTGLMFDGPDHSAVDQTRVTQPALVALEVALAELWRSWGVLPAVVMGHSVGEIAAAIVAGVLDLRSGMRLIAHRARLMQATEPGAMLAVAAGERQVSGWLGEEPDPAAALDIAAVNGPSATVVSGRCEAVDRLAARLRAAGVRCRPLAGSHAFHSALLDPMAAEFAAAIAGLRPAAPATPMISTLTGDLIGPGECDADYWWRHARGPVRFYAGATRLETFGVDVCLEIGPDRTMVNLIRSAGLLPPGGGLPSLSRGTPEETALSEAADALLPGGHVAATGVIP